MIMCPKKYAEVNGGRGEGTVRILITSQSPNEKDQEVQDITLESPVEWNPGQVMDALKNAIFDILRI